ncbi:MAG TPA: cyclic 2,3-diphosphoglycerate synthase [Burkholderiales bacterium]|nr:cyclic 2,3-diphosphoglycerate synthase [Burkholderiales bacterium]
MTQPSRRLRLVIMGAAGRDFHNFNVAYRDDPGVDVVAFTATQIPGIAHRRYPPALAGALYPEGIPIVDEAELEKVIRGSGVDQVVFAYSDVPHAQVMHVASRALSAGADFLLLGPHRTMLQARVPVIAVSAVRTGCGKSQTARYLSRLLRQRGLRVGVIRHPMPYGNLERQAVQRFASRADLDAGGCTIEEREEYEPHLAAGNTVYAGVDYGRILALAETDCDVLLWDGGNNDFPFLRPDLHIVLVDPLRPGHETSHHPGEVVLRMADIIVAAKCDSAFHADVERVIAAARKMNPDAAIAHAASPITLDDPAAVRGRRALVVEDGPTTTHGGMPWGAGYLAAKRAGAAAIVDPRDYAAPDIAAVYAAYPHIGPVLPAMGYSPQQVAALQETIERAPAEVVVAATPIDLAALLRVSKPVVRARYEFAEAGEPTLASLVEAFVERSLRP